MKSLVIGHVSLKVVKLDLGTIAVHLLTDVDIAKDSISHGVTWAQQKINGVHAVTNTILIISTMCHIPHRDTKKINPNHTLPDHGERDHTKTEIEILDLSLDRTCRRVTEDIGMSCTRMDLKPIMINTEILYQVGNKQCLTSVMEWKYNGTLLLSKGYARVPTADRPHVKYRHSYPGPPSGHWVPVSSDPDPQVPGGLGAPRYWPVAYLHKGPPPNKTYFRYNETQPTTTERQPRPDNQRPIDPRPQDPRPLDARPQDPRPQIPKDITLNKDDKPLVVESRTQRDERPRKLDNKTDVDLFHIDITKLTTTTPKIEETTVVVKELTKANNTVVELIKPEIQSEKEMDGLKIDDKLDDFSSIEVLDIEDAKKGEKISDLKTLEAEERQIEAIGRLLASRRGTKLVLEKRSQKDLEAKSIAVDKDTVDFNFGNKFSTTERRGIIQRVTKDEIEREKSNDKSLEVSETTFVRPPRVLSTTENIRKAIVNGKIFYDATIREQRDIFSNTTRKPKFRHLDDIRAPSIITNSTFGKKKIIKARNVNPVRRVRRVYRKRYNPGEVRRRLLERERSKTEGDNKKI